MVRWTATSLAALLCAGCAAEPGDAAVVETREMVEREDCPAGQRQSPIDLPTSIAFSDLDSLTVDYQESHVAIANTGRTVQYTYDVGSAVSVGAARFELIQFHFHAHSEHAISGMLSPMEMHLVHRDASGHLLVLALLIEQGAHNPVFDLASWSALPSQGSVDVPEQWFNVRDLIPGGPTYRYTGSLTAPPCTGDVSWIVFQQALTLDAAQIATFTRLYPHNVRQLQPLGARELSFGE